MPQSFGWILVKQSKRVEILGLKSEKFRVYWNQNARSWSRFWMFFLSPPQPPVLLHTSPPTPFGWKLTRAYFKKEEKLGLKLD